MELYCTNRYGHTAHSSMIKDQKRLKLFEDEYMKTEKPTTVVSYEHICLLHTENLLDNVTSKFHKNVEN